MSNVSIAQIYPELENIQILERDAIRIIDSNYKRRFCPDKSELTKESMTVNIDELTELKSGRYTIFLEGAHFEIFFHKGESQKMYVMLESARKLTPTKSPLPRFQRWSWCHSTPYSWVVFSDPMYYEYDDLNPGWFYGNKNVNYRELVVKIINKFCELLDVDNDNIVFYGSSSGGTAAIHCAALMNKGTAVAINPQLDFKNENHLIRQFHENVSDINLLKPDNFFRNDPCRLIRESGNNVQYILIENLRSKGDMNHLSYLSKVNNIQPVYGLSKFKNTTVLVYDCDTRSVTTHSAVDTNQLFFAIDFLTQIVKETDSIEEYKPLYRWVVDLWKEYYVLTDKIAYYKNRQLQKIIINNIVLCANQEEQYKCYKYSKIKQNYKYTLEIKKDDIFCTADTITIGIYDSKNKKMDIINNYTIKNDIFFKFNVKGNCDNKHITIFSGIRGNTKNNSLKIKKIIITEESENQL